MEPYFRNEKVTIYHGDCIEVMQNLYQDGVSVDCCITDPPYGITACKWDAVIPFDTMWKCVNALLKQNAVVCLFGSEPFSSYLRLSNLPMWKYDWIWNKGSFANFLNVKFQPGKVHEIISVFSQGASSYSKNGNMLYIPQFEQGKPYQQRSGKQKTDNANSSVRSKIQQTITKNDGVRYPTSIINFDKDKESLHPTQKPIALLEYLVKTYTNENDLVLDFTAGSGTTGVACMHTNRCCILIEKEEKYCEISARRLVEVS